MYCSGPPKSAFNYDKVRIRLRCACQEYATPWADNFNEELALPAILENHKSRELCSGRHTHEAEFRETGEIRPVLV